MSNGQNEDTLSQTKAYARQMLADGEIRNHDLYAGICIEFKQRVDDPEASELLKQLYKLADGSYDTQPHKCKVDSCDKPSHSDGLCEEHYQEFIEYIFKDHYHKITINKQEAARGIEKDIVCNGKRLRVKIPAGIVSGTKLRLRGAGMTIDNIPYSIYVKVNIKR